MQYSSLFRWPAEWEPQYSTWIAWPHNPDTWPGHFEEIPATYLRFIRELSHVQRVDILSGPPGLSPSAADLVSELPNVALHQVPTNDTWIRDFGPTFVQERSTGQLVGINWRYNAWGGKYPPYDLDAAAAARICQIVGCRCIESPMVCEGGGLETDGRGTLLATSNCLMTPTRNPGWSRDEIEFELVRCLGTSHIIWVDGGGLAGDDTDGHIDQLARFVAPGRVVAAVSSRGDDPNALGLMQNVDILRASRDAQGVPLEIFELPTPTPRFVDGKRIPESYCNYLLANGIAIVPTFRVDKTDRQALDILSELMPDRIIIPLDAYHLIRGLGAFHCASQHQPQPQPSRATVQEA